jgi:hypothetical protein
VNFADLVGLTGVIKDALSQGGFTCVNMGHNPNIAHPLEWLLSRHAASFFS